MSFSIKLLFLNAALKSAFLSFLFSPFAIVLGIQYLFSIPDGPYFMVTFFIGLGGMIGLMGLFKNQARRIFARQSGEITPVGRDFWLTAIAWLRAHESAEPLLVVGGIIALAFPFFVLANWLTTIGVPSTGVIGAMVFIPFFLAFITPMCAVVDFYEMVVKPKRTSVSEILRIMEKANSGFEMSKTWIEKSAKTDNLFSDA